ncbi:MAG TPA: hypothetical protein VHO90_08990 [Bacteroidales bacterium]|nr:hypothetical protein [Bacteroidales bacterium]
MNVKDYRYNQFSLCREMLQTVDVIRSFNPEASAKYLPQILRKKKLFLTGEGSSRIFPAKHLLYQNAMRNCGIEMFTEGATQALEYDLSSFCVMGMSNSGKTKELIRLFSLLKEHQHPALFGVTANKNTPLEQISYLSDVLACGTEQAVAASKSVVEQALFYHSIYHHLLQQPMVHLDVLASQMEETLTTPIKSTLVKTLKEAPVIYFAGRNNGVAEEITLKTNEIARKRSGYLEGTYAVHGIEEVLNPRDVVVIFEPFPDEEEKFRQVLIEGVGVEVIAISSRPTIFNTIRIPDGGIYRNYLELAMGWNMLTEIGIEMGINLDKPVHARKIGNEFASLI